MVQNEGQSGRFFQSKKASLHNMRSKNRFHESGRAGFVSFEYWRSAKAGLGAVAILVVGMLVLNT
jgi:hypothetical protein